MNASLLSSGNYERLIKDRDAKYVGTTLLSPPQIASVFKNVAVAYTLLRDGTTRVGIVWRTPFLEEARSELYIYDIPEAVHHEPCASYGSVCSLANAFETSKHSDEVAILQRCRVVQGKRISSLSPCVGGTHPCSPIAGLAFPEEISLGGLQMLHTMGNQDAYPHDVQYQKCFVWGPVYSEDRTSQISFKIIDFSFADPQHLKSLIYKNLPLTYKKTRRLPRQPIPTIESVHCPCVLHDTGFRIILPCVTASQSTLFERPKAWTTWQWQQRRLPKAVVLDGSISRDWLEAEGAWRNPWFGPRKADCLSEDVRGESVESIGTISRNDTPARQSALQRQHQWLVGRIRGMKRESLNDFEIAELWSAADWTQWGQIRKPEGWRHL